MFGPGYEELYREAQEKYNIKFVRGRLSEASENREKQLLIKVEDTLVGKPLKMTLDLMVLMVGMEPSEGSTQLASMLGLDIAPNGFIRVGDPHTGTNRNQPARHFYCRMQLLSHEPDRHTHRCTFCSDHYRRISEK